MTIYGRAPFLECSSRGDKRFSAFYARVNGCSIEEQYQAAKIFRDAAQDFIGRRRRDANQSTLLNELLRMRGCGGSTFSNIPNFLMS